MANPTAFFVCIPVADVAMGNFEGFFSVPDDDKRLWFPVGTLAGYDGIDLSDAKMAARDLGLLADVQPLVMPLLDRPGFVGGLMAIAAFVPNYDIAKQLPGFTPLWHDIGYVWQQPPVAVDTHEGISRHRFTGDALPAYKDGVFACSMIPQGQIAVAVYFENDPLNFYWVQGHSAMNGISDAISATQAWRAANP